MWLFTPEGFVSVVADRDQPADGRLLMRARARHHLEALLPKGGEIFQVPKSDYAWRAWISREQLKQVVAAAIDELDYPNFKNAIEERAYHDACMGVWEEMYLYQLNRQGPNR